jgi:hypothetical protein
MDPAGATAVVIASSQCAVLGPSEFLQSEISAGGPMACTCISVQDGADHTVIADMHIANWTTGVDFSQPGGAANTHIRNCEIQCYFTALNIEVGSDEPVTGVKVTSTLLTRGNDSGGSGSSSPVVLIDPGGYGNSLLSDITLTGCTAYNSGDPAGVLVSNCDMTGYGSASPVRVTGFPARLRITGCPGYNNSNTSLTASHTQLTTGVNAATSTTAYYGPSVFMYSNPMPLTLHVFGQSIVASTGIFSLPSAYDTFFFNSAPASFTWIGQ